jgi:hypothetical protein
MSYLREALNKWVKIKKFGVIAMKTVTFCHWFVGIPGESVSCDVARMS